MNEKRSPIACDDRALQANSKYQHNLHNDFAVKSQDLSNDDMRISRLIIRFGLTPSTAALIAGHAYGTGAWR